MKKEVLRQPHEEYFIGETFAIICYFGVTKHTRRNWMTKISRHQSVKGPH
jgi:hypothetical protein